MNTDRLKALALSATPGPWKTAPASGELLAKIDTGYASLLCCDYCHGSVRGNLANADVEYLAAANPAAILELISERDALKAQLDELQEWHDGAGSRNAFILVAPEGPEYAPKIGHDGPGFIMPALLEKGDPRVLRAFGPVVAGYDVYLVERGNLHRLIEERDALNSTLDKIVALCEQKGVDSQAT